MAKLGSTLVRFDSLPSTNDRVRDIAAAGAEEGLAVVAAQQTAGRGRHGRTWASPAGEGLYLSILLRPRIKAAQTTVITLAAAVAVAEMLSLDLGIPADIKWPNDVLAAGRKICGILVEAATEGELLQYAVLGVGVNVGQREFPYDLRQSATSVFMESGKELSPDQLLRPLLDRLETSYRMALARPAQVIEKWQRLSSSASGAAVRILSGDGDFEGTTRGLNPSGALIVELPDGTIREIVSGEVSLRTKASGTGLPG